MDVATVFNVGDAYGRMQVLCSKPTYGQECVANLCECSPRTCDDIGHECGLQSDGCPEEQGGGQIDCGACPPGLRCAVTDDGNGLGQCIDDTAPSLSELSLAVCPKMTSYSCAERCASGYRCCLDTGRCVQEGLSCDELDPAVAEPGATARPGQRSRQCNAPAAWQPHKVAQQQSILR